MKKLMFVLVASFIMLSVQNSFAGLSNVTSSVLQDANKDWKSAKDGMWMGKDKTWYKLDANMMLTASKDGMKWEPVKEGMWQDIHGKWLKYQDHKVMMSSDNGKTWSQTRDNKWEGPDNTMYKIDDKGHVMMMMKEKSKYMDKKQSSSEKLAK